jgi:hypothetical protein
MGWHTTLEKKMKIEWTAIVWARNKEKSGASRRDPMAKRRRWCDIVACLENLVIIILSGYLLYSYRR